MALSELLTTGLTLHGALNLLNRLKFPIALQMPLLDPIVVPAAQPGEKRGVETVGDGVSSPIGWHVDCVWAKSERFDSDGFAARERPSSNPIRMEKNFAA